MEYDVNSFVSTLLSVFSQVKFNIFKKDHIEIIIKYLTSIGIIEKNAKPLLNDIVNISKGMGQTESLIQYAMALAHFERKQKIGISGN
jgi:hypothetical protein